MSCDATSNGEAQTSDDAIVQTPPNFETTDATLQSLRIGDLAQVGAGLTVFAQFFGIQDTGERGNRLSVFGEASRNAVGSNSNIVGAFGEGYTDIATPPWTTIAVPAGWAVPALVVTGTVVTLTWSGAAGQIVRWSIRAVVQRVGGAIA